MMLIAVPDRTPSLFMPRSAAVNVPGERFRIRIGTTFEGDLELDNFDPQGERKCLYPGSAISIPLRHR